jgi:hypothetical protein
MIGEGWRFAVSHLSPGTTPREGWGTPNLLWFYGSVGYNTGQSPELQPNAELVPSAAIFDPLSKSREHSV